MYCCLNEKDSHSSGMHPIACKSGLFILRSEPELPWISVRGMFLEKAEHQAASAWTTRKTLEKKRWVAEGELSTSNLWLGYQWRRRKRQTGLQREWTMSTREAKLLKGTSATLNPSVAMKSENHDAGVARQIRRPETEGHVLTGHASFQSWCAACVQG